MTHGRRTMRAATIVVLALTAAACGSSAGSSGGPTVDVSLKDFSIDLTPDSVPAGEVTFEASNAGPTTHEFEIFSVDGDADPNALPVEDGVANTDGLTLVDEQEDITVGANPSLSVELQPGTYGVICNLPGHYQQGMHAVLTVR
jgi:uncharacterized cupredoxin-like copper-binding protein